MNGGSLWQDVKGHMNSHRATNLVPELGPFTRGAQLLVSSDHHQVMVPHEKGEVLLIAQDNHKKEAHGWGHKSTKERPTTPYDVESVYYHETKSLCYQPHPEYVKDAQNEQYFFSLLDRLFWR